MSLTWDLIKVKILNIILWGSPFDNSENKYKYPFFDINDYDESD